MAARAAETGGSPTDPAPTNWAVEWFTAYAEYLKRAAGQSANTIELYQQITDRIVRGDLAPTATQEMLTSFVRVRGSAYSDELARLNVRFFGEMVRIGAAYAYELGQAVVPGSSDSPPAPPEFDPANPADWFQGLNDYSARLGTTIAATYQALVDRAAAGEVAPGEIQESAAAYLQRRLPDYLAELGTLYFDLLNGANELRVRSEHEFLNGVLGLADGAGAAPPFELRLTAPLGEVATASLTISNTRDETSAVSGRVTDARRADGVDAAFAPDITFVPGELELEPDEEARLELRLTLDEETYEPEALYIATLEISGHGEPRLDVPLRITATRPVSAKEV